MFRDQEHFSEEIMDDVILNLLLEQERLASPTDFNEVMRSRTNFIFSSNFDETLDRAGEIIRHNGLFDFDSQSNENRQEPTTIELAESSSLNGQEIKKQDFHNKRISQTAECSICLLDMKKSSFIPSLECKHQYHRKCLMKWIQKQETCPLCRVDLSSDFK